MNRKNLTAVVLAGIMAFSIIIGMVGSVQADFQKCATGSWYNPENNGEGISLEVLYPDLIIGYYYTHYGVEDKWYAMILPFDGIGDVYTSSHDSKNVRWVGRATIDILNDDEILVVIDLTYDFNRYDDPDTTIPWCIGCQKALLYNRLTTVVPCE